MRTFYPKFSGEGSYDDRSQLLAKSCFNCEFFEAGGCHLQPTTVSVGKHDWCSRGVFSEAAIDKAREVSEKSYKKYIGAIILDQKE